MKPAVAALVSLFAMSVSVVAHAQSTCKFILGYATPIPSWSTSAGTAAVHAQDGKLDIQLFDDGLPEGLRGQVSHTLVGTLKSGRVSATYKNLFSDEGTMRVTGTYALRRYRDAAGPHVVESLVVENASVFVAVACHAKDGT